VFWTHARTATLKSFSYFVRTGLWLQYSAETSSQENQKLFPFTRDANGFICPVWTSTIHKTIRLIGRWDVDCFILIPVFVHRGTVPSLLFLEMMKLPNCSQHEEALNSCPCTKKGSLLWMCLQTLGYVFF